MPTERRCKGGGECGSRCEKLEMGLIGGLPIGSQTERGCRQAPGGLCRVTLVDGDTVRGARQPKESPNAVDPTGLHGNVNWGPSRIAGLFIVGWSSWISTTHVQPVL